tara:strand:- start:27 stop:350 length:324 start_codon:yes stop_codon:yes gene_type:complete
VKRTYATELKEMRDANRDTVPLPTIEKGVTVPPNGSYFKKTFPAHVAQMEVGDSFYIDSRSPESVQGTVSYCTKKLFETRGEVVKYTTRSYPATPNKPRGVRVWRIK